MEEVRKIAADYWSRQPNTGRTRWWSEPVILRHLNRLVCGEAIEGAWAGLNRRIRTLMPEGGFARAISIGCGEGSKEITLLNQGIVRRFELFDLSDTRLQKARDLSERCGVADKVATHVKDAFATHFDEPFDLVYWNNSLHHMLDVHEAVEWSNAHLADDGVIIVDDFVGPSRFQWTDVEIRIANQVRELLPEHFLIDPRDFNKRIPRSVTRPSIEGMIAMDPTEAADSASIIPALKACFPTCEVIATGGVVYQLALNDILANFHDENDYALLNSLLLLDEQVAKTGLTHYAVAIARKSEATS